MIRTTSGAAALAMFLIGSSLAQDKTKQTHERLQPYWNQLELTEKQREQYDRVVREYGPKIDKLEEELEALKERRRKDWQAILTPPQKKKLETLLAARGKKKPGDAKVDDKPSEDDAPKTKKSKSTKADKKVEAEGETKIEEKKPSKKKPKSSKDDG